MNNFSQEIKQFIKDGDWVFAKTYAKTWPHHYFVHDRVDSNLFYLMVSHIRSFGYKGKFYNHEIVYFDEDCLVYWTMMPPIDHKNWYPVEEEAIINRCPFENTYEYRLRHDDLPDKDRNWYYCNSMRV